jgi:thymidylate synthase
VNELVNGHETFESMSREGMTHEIIGWNATLCDVDRAFLLNPRRAISPAYAAAEFFWIWSGDSDISRIVQYAPQYKRFASKYNVVHGAYGARLAYNAGTVHQLELIKLIHALTPDSRRMVVTLYDANDLNFTLRDRTPDIPCTLTWQFINRLGYLHMVCNMRSEDVWLGMPYDIFVGTCFQYILAGELGLRVGTYRHNVGSLHLYEKNYDAAVESLKCIPLWSLRSEWQTTDTFDTANKGTGVASHVAEHKNDTEMKNVPLTGMINDLLCCILSFWGIAHSPPLSPALVQGLENHANRRGRRPSRKDDVVS